MDPEIRSWLRGIAFHAHAAPESLNRTDLDRLADLFRSGLDAETLPHARETMKFFVASHLGRPAIEAIVELLSDASLGGPAHEALVQCLRFAVCWRRPLIPVAELVRVSALDHLRFHRTMLVDHILEPCLFRLAPGEARVTMGSGLEMLSPYCSSYLGTPVAFRLQAEVAAKLGLGRRRVLMVHNIRDRLGDEIVRCVPLLQALVDFNPELEITVLAKRVYLYSHPRIWTFDIREPFTFEEPYDAVIDFFGPPIPRLNFSQALENRLQEFVEAHPPFLLVSANKGENHFVFDRVDLAGRPLAQVLSLDQRRVPRNYETTFRLIAELGLPLRWGENPPCSQPVLAGVPWAEADAAWKAVTLDNTEQRPVALLMPYGGAESLKGATDPQYVAAQLERLTAEGFFVILIPVIEKWGSLEHAHSAIACLPALQQIHVALAPDPADAGDYDSHGRVLLYFIQSADRIAAAEGWMIHAAYCLGKPYEILIFPYSHNDEWHPYAASPRQDVLQDPRQFRKFARHFWLEQAREPEDLAALLSAAAEPCKFTRAAAACGLAHFPLAETRATLAKLLADPNAQVRASAARGLLAEEKSERERAILRAHILIGYHPPDWAGVQQLGPAVSSAVERAEIGDDAVLRREASSILVLMAHPHKGKRAAPVTRPGKFSIWRRELGSFLRHRNPSGPKILILTPMKDAADCLDEYCAALFGLTYPHDLISLGILESDSIDGTFSRLQQLEPRLKREFRRAQIWKNDFAFQLPLDRARWAQDVQAARRVILARSRNRLLFRALDDEDWVLWLDADVVEYPGDILQKLLETGKDIVHPNCVKSFGGPSFDRNAWRDHGRLHLDDLRGEGPLVKLDAVGGTMLLVRADAHRDGLIFPAFPYGRLNPRIRHNTPELETEGLGLMAQDMGYQCWGMPHLEIRHREG